LSYFDFYGFCFYWFLFFEITTANMQLIF